jgi:hypothetical protein
MQRHFERAARVAARPDEVFSRLDDQTRLAAHMEKPSAMMGGGRMTYEFDEGRGQAIGSHIKMGGSAFGVSLYVDEVVVERAPPGRKLWRTVGATRLLIMGPYEMGFEIQPDATGSRLRVWIDYDLPKGLFGRLLGFLFAGFYAQWCVGRMVADAASHFAATAVPAAAGAGAR